MLCEPLDLYDWCKLIKFMARPFESIWSEWTENLGKCQSIVGRLQKELTITAEKKSYARVYIAQEKQTMHNQSHG